MFGGRQEKKKLLNYQSWSQKEEVRWFVFLKMSCYSRKKEFQLFPLKQNWRFLRLNYGSSLQGPGRRKSSREVEGSMCFWSAIISRVRIEQRIHVELFKQNQLSFKSEKLAVWTDSAGHGGLHSQKSLPPAAGHPFAEVDQGKVWRPWKPFHCSQNFHQRAKRANCLSITAASE